MLLHINHTIVTSQVLEAARVQNEKRSGMLPPSFVYTCVNSGHISTSTLEPLICVT